MRALSVGASSFIRPSKHFNHSTAIAVATGKPICDDPIYCFDDCFDLLSVGTVIVRPGRFYVLEVIDAVMHRFMKSDRDLTRRRTVLDEF